MPPPASTPLASTLNPIPTPTPLPSQPTLTPPPASIQTSTPPTVERSMDAIHAAELHALYLEYKVTDFKEALASHIMGAGLSVTGCAAFIKGAKRLCPSLFKHLLGPITVGTDKPPDRVEEIELQVSLNE